MKRKPTEWHRILSSYTSDRWLISRTQNKVKIKIKNPNNAFTKLDTVVNTNFIKAEIKTMLEKLQDFILVLGNGKDDI